MSARYFFAFIVLSFLCPFAFYPILVPSIQKNRFFTFFADESDSASTATAEKTDGVTTADPTPSRILGDNNSAPFF